MNYQLISLTDQITQIVIKASFDYCKATEALENNNIRYASIHNSLFISSGDLNRAEQAFQI